MHGGLLDILISDIGMPELNGYGLMQQIRTLPNDRAKQLPAIAPTAYVGKVDQQQALCVGFDHHLPKPVEPEQLVTLCSSVAQMTAATSIAG